MYCFDVRLMKKIVCWSKEQSEDDQHNLPMYVPTTGQFVRDGFGAQD